MGKPDKPFSALLNGKIFLALLFFKAITEYYLKAATTNF